MHLYNDDYQIDGNRKFSGIELQATLAIPFDIFKKKPAKTEPKPEPVVQETYTVPAAKPEKPCYTLEEIDEMNILEADLLAMRRAIAMLSPAADFALIDGNCTKEFTLPVASVVKGDAKSCSIAAASILAKVTRDRLCEEHDRLYPEYGFAKHKGYGTAAHMEAIRKYGPCPLHRKTFLKFLDK